MCTCVSIACSHFGYMGAHVVLCRMFTTGLLLLLLFALGCEGSTCASSDGIGLMQITQPVRSSWKTTRDLATVSTSKPLQVNDKLFLRFLSAVPVFENQSSYIALIHNRTDALQRYLSSNDLFCTGPERSHRAKLRVSVSWRIFTIFRCDWPKDYETGEYEVNLEDANGDFIGQVQVSSKPSLLRQYRTMACVRNLWNDPAANVSGLRDFPQWLDYHHVHGIDHFIIYTTSDMSPALQEVYQPYIDEGLVTRVHLDEPAERCWCSTCMQQLLIANDCLYRAKGHARWLLPTLDVDEYLRVRSSEDVTAMLDEQANLNANEMVNSVIFKKYRFARRLTGDVEISSPRYSHVAEDKAMKYVVNVSLVKAVSIHHPVQAQGMRIYLQPTVAAINHYRHPTWMETDAHSFVNYTDDSLLTKVPMLEETLKRRYGQQWKTFLEKVSRAPELVEWSCSGWSLKSNGPPSWKDGQTKWCHSLQKPWSCHDCHDSASSLRLKKIARGSTLQL